MLFLHVVVKNLKANEHGFPLQVSVDYLTKPLDVFKEMSRILKPGGLAIMR